MRFAPGLALMLAVALGLGACGGDVTQTSVTLNADTSLLPEATSLRVTVRPAGNDPELVREVEVDRSQTRLATLFLVPLQDDPSRTFEVDAELMAGATVVGRLRVHGDYVEGEKRVINAFFDARCDVSCGPGTTCVGGDCVGSCFEASSGVDELHEPVCGVCEVCVNNRCEPAEDGASCGECDGDVCQAGRCEPRVEALDVEASWIHTCADTDRGLHCWGSGFVGQTGQEGRAMSDVPELVSGDFAAGTVKMALGGEYTCVLWIRSGPEFGRSCFGWASRGVWATDLESRPPPTEFRDEGAGAQSTIVSSDFATCMLRGDGVVVCTGSNAEGQLGPMGEGLEFSAGWIEIPGEWDELFAGDRGFCALREGQPFCWGAARIPAGPEPQPVAVEDACSGRVATLAISGPSGCIVLEASGQACCWGDNRAGRLGTASSALEVPRASPVLGGLAFTALSMERSPEGVSVCGAGEDGALYCWGDNRANILGTGDLRVRTEPTRVIEGAGSAIVDVSLGHGYGCAVRDDGRMYCWGRNGSADTIGGRPAAGWLGLGLGTDGEDPAAREGVTRPEQVCFPEPG
ncbi:MAG: hypothetical protein AAF645_27435 [Myxococcota bacterium]